MSHDKSSFSIHASCKLWVHDDSFSNKDILFNLSSFPGSGITEQHLLVVTLASSKPDSIGTSAVDGSSKQSDGLSNRRHGLVFFAKDCDEDIKSRHTALQLSVSTKVAKLFGFKNLTEVLITEGNKKIHSASHVEICFRDVYLTRADLRRLVAANLLNQTLFEGESITFLGSIRASVKSIYHYGHKVRSALFEQHTKPVFRCESARYILYIQMSREMWDFDTEGSGEIVFNKVVKSVLPAMFQKWTELGVRHLVSVVLFTRLQRDNHSASLKSEPGKDPDQPHRSFGDNDFYRVVVGEMYSGEWAKILFELQREFKCFLRDVLTATTDKTSIPQLGDVANMLTSAKHGNFLEAINLASSRFGKDWIDPDLVRSGLSVIVISPGSGHFQVDETMLKLTNENLVRNGVSIDLICLSQPPLHETPIFGIEHKRPNVNHSHRSSHLGTSIRSVSGPDIGTSVPGDTDSNPIVASRASPFNCIYVVPQWIQIHFWSNIRNISRLSVPLTNHRSDFLQNMPKSNFIPACRMYEVQMTGIMENEMSDISLPFLYVDRMNITDSLHQRASHKIEDTPYRSSFHDSPPKSIYLSSDFRRHLSPKRTVEKSPKILQDQDWMDEYDKVAFESHESRGGRHIFSTTSHQPLDRPKRTATTSRPHNLARNPLPASSSSLINSRQQDMSSQQGTVSASDKASSFKAKMPRQRSKESLNSPKSSQKVSPFLNLTGSLRGTSKATPSMQYTAEVAVSAHLQLGQSESGDESDLLKSGPIYGKVRNSLLRNSSMSKIESVTPSTPPASSSSEAVSIPRSITTHPLPDQEASNPPSYQSLNQEMTIHARSRPKTSSLNVPWTFESPDASLEVNLDFPISPWLPPCNPLQQAEHITEFGSPHGWTHVFVSRVRNYGIKWKSLCSPAVLPLSSDFNPSKEALQSYEENSYKVTLADDELTDIPAARARLIDQMVSFRLTKGFQLLPKAHSLQRENKGLNSIHFYKKSFEEDNLVLHMSKGNGIHVIHASGPELQVTRYRPQETVRTSEVSLAYSPRIKTTFEHNYVSRSLVISALPEDLNWSAIDNFMAGYPSSFTNAVGFWRARFVLIPVGPPNSARRPFPALAEDSDDEIYIEGIQRLTQLWEKSRINPPDSQILEPTYQSDPNPNPLNLEFQTRDASAVIFAGLDESLLQEDQSPFPPSQLFSDRELYHSGKIDVRKLAQDLQSENGIKMQDRRWYFRVHPNCFVGLDLTSWLLYHFQDIDNRESAIELGQSLMDKGLFKHVSGRHKFRDGNYFYQITTDFRISKPDARSSWFSRKTEKSPLPSTPHLDVSVDAISPSKGNAKAVRADTPVEFSNAVPKNNQERGRQKIRLSSMIQCDVDFRKRSDRSELVDLHYDRLYNPDSCYHFRLEWMNTTAKMVDDAISSWAANTERYGLKLVQVPLVEASRIAETNPFRSPYIVQLAVTPPRSMLDSTVEITSPSLQPQPSHSPNLYLKALLRKLGFVLESEAALNFPPDINVSYSWGHDVPYRNSQYIHKTGVILAQITETGRFLLVANRLADNRSSYVRDSTRFDRRGKRDEISHWSPKTKDTRLATPSLNRTSALASPSMPAIGDNSIHQVPMGDEKHIPTAEQLKDQIEAFCHDEAALRTFFDEVKVRDPSQSAKSTPLLTAAIPKLELPSASDFSLSAVSEGDNVPEV